MALCLAGCGEGLYTHGVAGPEIDASSEWDARSGDGLADAPADAGSVVDLFTEWEAGSPTESADLRTEASAFDGGGPPDVLVRGDAAITSVTMEVGPGKGILEIPEEASLLISAGTFVSRTRVTLRAAEADMPGTIGPTYEVEAPSGTSFRGRPTLEIKFSPDPSIPLELVGLAFLTRSSGETPFWVAIQESSYDESKKVLSGLATNIGAGGHFTVQFAPVRICGEPPTCPPLDRCMGGACQ